ncbi:hypothetical protein [Streptomyces sp. NPDC060035]|uniref:hypothetical protein n=1 Tax=Streptomyces sp. NPDC060035 TaxID=3347044 RepID=UPI0036A77098
MERVRFEQCVEPVLDVVESTGVREGCRMLEDGRPVPGVRRLKGGHLCSIRGPFAR